VTRCSWLVLLILACSLPAIRGSAQEAATYVPQAGKFPPPGTGTYLAGELVFIDPVNRRGGLRLDGNGDERYHSGPLHYFALLPYGEISRNGAPAELKAIPLGTHVHGYFYVPPISEEATIPPLPKDMEKFQIKQNHAISLEDDFSFYQRRGQSWKVVSIDPVKGKINVTPTGTLVKDGINTAYTFDIDEVTKVWKGRTLVELSEIAPDQTVQFNLGWCPGWRDKEFGVAEIWLDDAGRKFATDLQRRRHVKYQKQRWLPAWIDSVEDNDFGGGTVTLTLFGGMDPSLYAELKATQDKGYGVAVAEKSLRTWFHRSDKKIGQVVDWKEIPDPPVGSSGIQIRMKFTELLEGYRPGRVVRVKCHDWTFVTMPTEERIKTNEEQQRAATFGLP
jgi:hypothetical protein